MADQLQIVIGADTAPLRQGLDQASRAVETFDDNVQQAAQSSGKAGYALQNLGRVASDAPFGFIAISNNIEPLVQSFTDLKKESGTVGGALKELGRSLAGPQGLLLALNLVISGITIAVQKYGSLGNAIDALFGNYSELNEKVTKAAESQKKFNENLKESKDIAQQEAASVQSQISKAEALSKIATDNTESYKKRNAALKELATLSPAYFGNLEIENGLVKGLTEALTGYTNSVIASAKAKGFESEISKIAPQIYEQTTALELLRKKRDEIAKQPVRIVGAAATNLNTAALQDANNAYEAQKIVVQQLNTRLKELETQLSVFTNAQVDERVSTDAATDAIKKKTDSESKASQTRDKNIQTTRNAIDAEKQLNLQLELQRKLRSAPTTVALDSSVSRIKQIADANSAAAKKAAADQAKLKDAFGFDALVPNIDFTALEEKVRAGLARVAEIGESNKQKLIDQTQAISDSFNTLLAPSIDAVFGALATGQNAFKALGDSLKQLVVQLAATVIKAAALAAILTVVGAATGNPLPGGFGAAFGSALGGQGGGIGSLLGVGRVRGAAAPTFPRGTAFTGGGMQLAGNVTFVQRGPDLVGVLNQGNARINRVG